MPKNDDVVDDAALAEQLGKFAKDHKIDLRKPEVDGERPAAIEGELLPSEPEDPRLALYGGVIPDFVKRGDANEAPEGKRAPGRPARGEGPRWQEIEHAFVFGEPYQGEDGAVYVRFPSMLSLARRFRVHEKTLASRVKKEQWLERRARISSKTDEVVEDALVAQRAGKQIDVRAAATEACNTLIGSFLGAVSEGKIAITTAADFERITRLALRLSGEADKTHEHSHTISLEDIQERRANSRRRHSRLPENIGEAGRGGLMPPVVLPIAVGNE